MDVHAVSGAGSSEAREKEHWSGGQDIQVLTSSELIQNPWILNHWGPGASSHVIPRGGSKVQWDGRVH